MTRSLRIAYLFESSAMSGGHRVAISQADALVARGHRVRCVTRGGAVDWRSSKAEWVHVDTLDGYDASGDDAVIATFWTTISPAHRIAPGRAVHLCQGYEGLFSYYQPALAEIEAAYRLPLPKMVVSPHLVEICSRFCNRVEWIGQIVDEVFFRELPKTESDPLRLLLVGEFEIDLRGVAEAYEAIRIARSAGARFDLVRVSSLPPAAGEPAAEAAEFHFGVANDAMTPLVHSCDLALAPNHAEEGFGLPAAEAMASGLPLIATRIPAFLSYAERQDYALFAEPSSPASLADAIARLVGDSSLRSRLRVRGREVAESFDAAAVAERIERLLLSL